MILFFTEVGPQELPRVGGKGANLGSLARAGFNVPPGFCVTTDGFRAFIAGCRELPALYDRLDALLPDDVAGARQLGSEVRAALLQTPLPEPLVAEALRGWQKLGSQHAYAVRSSATAEDLPGASFAGQQDTYLNILGEPALLDAIRRCFASLYTDRAILYRQKGGFGHRQVALSVVVQRMVFPDAAGILFTADPVSGHRGILSIDAGFGLGEALVSGLVTADLYRVDKRTGAIKELRIGEKSVAIRPLADGGTVTEKLPPAQQKARVLSDDAVRELCELGKKVESHYGGQPQDVEWCREGGKLFLVQARPITSLYPLPQPLPADGGLHIYLSFGHVQNMVEPFSPLGRDLWQNMLPFGKTRLTDVPQQITVVAEAGDRLFLDITAAMRLLPLRKLVLSLLRRVYPDAAILIESLLARPEVQAVSPPRVRSLRLIVGLLAPAPPRILRQLLWGQPELIERTMSEYVERNARLYREQLRAVPAGGPRLRLARSLLGGAFAVLPHFAPLLGSGLIALGLLRDRFAGTAAAADVEALQRGLYGNITTEMDLQVGDLAELARPYPALVEALRRDASARQRSRASLEPLRELPGGTAFVAALDAFLLRFGMRGQGEIDVAQPRWAEQPGLLLNSILGSLARPAGAESAAHRAHFTRQQAEGTAAAERLVAAAGGPLARRWVARLCRCVRHGLGVREHPKYYIVQCLAELREVVVEAAQQLVTAGRLDAVTDVWFLRYNELLELVENSAAPDPRPLIVARKVERERAQHLKPPLIMTNEGEIPQLPRPRDLPAGALSGLGASAGVVEGIARVVLDPSTELLKAGEILVAPYTDPGWTPLFMHAAGLICDVGGLMTHGSVVAREYGIPAVVGVGDGTRRIRTGQRLRLDGNRGVIELLENKDSGAPA